MPFTDAKPIDKKQPIGTGISMGLSELKGGRQKVRLTFSERAQHSLFGEGMAGKRFHIQIGRGQDEGKLRMVLTEDGEFTASAGVRGSVTISCAAWDLLPKGKLPAGEVKVAAQPSNVEAILRLPTWARPSGVGGKMQQEFGIKPTKAAG